MKPTPVGNAIWLKISPHNKILSLLLINLVPKVVLKLPPGSNQPAILTLSILCTINTNIVMRDDLHRTVRVSRPWRRVLRHAGREADRVSRLPQALEEAVRIT